MQIVNLEWGGGGGGGGIDEQFTWHRNRLTEHFGLGAFFSYYTEVLQSEAFISTAVGDVMTGVDGLGGK